MESNPLVSLIVINWNGGKVFKDCLKSLSRLKYPAWELIVVDNGSSDGSQLYFKKFKLNAKKNILIQNKSNRGFAGGNNQAVKKARGKYILLLNNDTKIQNNLLKMLVGRMEMDPFLGVIQPKIKIMDNPKLLDNAGSFMTRIGFLKHWGFLSKDSKTFDKEREIFSAKGACMMIRKSIINKIGLFDDSFFSYFEESDFCWRVWLIGFKVLYYPKVEIYHKVGFTIKRLNVNELNYHYYKNRICSQIKNFEAKNLVLILIPHLIISLGIFTVFLIKFQLKNSWIILKAFWWNLVNLDSTLKKRDAVQKMRLITDDKLFSKLMVPIDWRQYIKDFRRIEQDLKVK